MFHEVKLLFCCDKLWNGFARKCGDSQTKIVDFMHAAKVNDQTLASLMRQFSIMFLSLPSQERGFLHDLEYKWFHNSSECPEKVEGTEQMSLDHLKVALLQYFAKFPC